MELTEQFILLQAPNPAAADHGRKLSRGGKFSGLCRSADGTLVWGECAGSGKTPYRVSIDWTDAQAPVCRCSCPSRQFPCKHALGLMFEQLSGKAFAEADIPQDLAEKRAKQAARAAKKAAAAQEPTEKKPAKSNPAAQAKRLNRQLEGLDMAEQMVEDLLNAGVGSLGGGSAKSYEQLAKELGNHYLTGPQIAFSRIALAVRNSQQAQDQAERFYAEALRVLIALRSTIKKGRVFLQQKLEAGQFTAEDTILFEAMGGVWRLEDLAAIGACRKNVRLVQLSFDVSYDEAKREYVERGFWLDLDTGHVDQTWNLRPVKALKYVKGEDSCFSLLEIPVLYTYPGEGCRRVRWESSVPRALTPEEQASLPGFAQPDIASAVKLAKNQMKNTLLPKFVPVLLPVGQVGAIDGSLVLEDPAGGRIVLRDRAEDGADHASSVRVTAVPGGLHRGDALFGLLFYDKADRSLCLHPYSAVTRTQIIRLEY